jgi:hypothetical protein
MDQRLPQDGRKASKLLLLIAFQILQDFIGHIQRGKVPILAEPGADVRR